MATQHEASGQSWERLAPRQLSSGTDPLPSAEPPAHAQGGSVLIIGRPFQAALVDSVLILRRLKSVAFKGGTFVNQIISFALKAAKLGCVLALAVASLFNIWHTSRSGQNVCRPASFDWSDILRLAHGLPPLLAPPFTSPSNLHEGFKWSMGGLVRTYRRGIEKAY